MNGKLRFILAEYGIDKQLKYLNTEVFELNEAVITERNRGSLESFSRKVACLFGATIDSDKNHITEELADVQVLLKQIQLHYNISSEEVKKFMVSKIERQLKRIKNQEIILPSRITYTPAGMSEMMKASAKKIEKETSNEKI